MDPVFIALIGVVCGGVFFKTLEGLLSQSKSTGTIAISAGEDYDRRWEDPEYVKMIHNTIRVERETLGEAVTNCECRACNPPEMVRMPILNKTWRDKSLEQSRRAGSKCEYRGCNYRVTGNNYYCHKHGTKNNGDFNEYYEMHVDQLLGPVAKWYAGDTNYKEETHIVFTRSGPKSLSRPELTDHINDIRKKDAERIKKMKETNRLLSMYNNGIISHSEMRKLSETHISEHNAKYSNNCAKCGILTNGKSYCSHCWRQAPILKTEKVKR